MNYNDIINANISIKTPCFILDQSKLTENISCLKKALEENWSNFIIGYSFKTNSLPWLINFFKEKGCYAEVVSKVEYELAKEVGYNINHIIYNGPIKEKRSFLEAANHDAIINIDSKRELNWLNELNDTKQYAVCLRVNYDLEKYCPGETQCGSEAGRFGFSYENESLKHAIHMIRNMKNVKLKGLHFHTSTKTKSVAVFKSHANIACKLKNEYDLNLKYINIGGGFFGMKDGAPSFNDYISSVTNILKQEFEPTKTWLIVEPGASLVSSPFDYLFQVTDTKINLNSNFVVTNGSRIHVDPLFKKNSYVFSRHPIRIRDIKEQIIVGFTCIENDRLFKIYDGQEFCVNDYIILHNVGSYTMCLSPLFIEYFPSVYLAHNNKLELIREEWSVHEYMQKSKK